MEKKELTILSRDGKQAGVTTGGRYKCRMEGCTGLRLATRWSDGKITFPCTKGLETVDQKTLRIG